MKKYGFIKQLCVATTVSLLSINAFSAEITGEFSRAFSGEGVQRIQLVFTVEGDGTSEYAVFAQGPSLANEGVTGFLANPKISLIRDGETIATNDNWGTDSNAARTQEVADYFGVTLDSLDAALVRTLGAGLYTVGVDGADGGVGITRVGAVDSSAAPVDGPDDPTDPEEVSEFCSREQCAADPEAAQQCQTSLEQCVAIEPEANHDECAAAAILFCGIEL